VPRHYQPVTQLAFTTAGRELVTLSKGLDLLYWNPVTGKVLPGARSFGTMANRRAILSPLGRTVVVWGEEGELRICDLRTGQETRMLTRDRTRPTEDDVPSRNMPVVAVAVTDNISAIAALHFAGAVSHWRWSGRKPFPTDNGSMGQALAFAPDGRTWAAVGGPDRSVVFRETATGRRRSTRDLESAAVHFAPDGRTVAARFGHSTIRVFDALTGTERCRCYRRKDGASLKSSAFSPDSRWIGAGYEDGTVSVWDAATGKELHRFRSDSGEAVLAVTFSPDGTRLATGNADTTVLLWDVSGLVPAGPQPQKPAKKLGTRELERLWAILAGEDAAAAWQAVHELAAVPVEAVPYLRERIQPVAWDPKRIAQLIADLDSRKFLVRQRATEELEELGHLAEGALRKAMMDKPSLEVGRRLQQLLARLGEVSFTRESLRTWRALEALELIGTSEVRPILEKVAEGAPSAPVTEEARAALGRLEARQTWLHGEKP
jgi:hypothetical protein